MCSPPRRCMPQISRDDKKEITSFCEIVFVNLEFNNSQHLLCTMCHIYFLGHLTCVYSLNLNNSIYCYLHFIDSVTDVQGHSGNLPKVTKEQWPQAPAGDYHHTAPCYPINSQSIGLSHRVKGRWLVMPIPGSQQLWIVCRGLLALLLEHWSCLGTILFLGVQFWWTWASWRLWESEIMCLQNTLIMNFIHFLAVGFTLWVQQRHTLNFGIVVTSWTGETRKVLEAGN